VGQDIGSALWRYWALGSPHTAVVCRPSCSQMRSVLPQVVMTSSFPTSWSHWLFPRFRRSKQYMSFLTAGLPCHFLSRSSYIPRAKIALPHQHPLDATKGAVRELLYLCCIGPHSPCIPRGHDNSCDCEILILCCDVTPIICYHLHVN